MIEWIRTLMPAKCPRCGELATDFVHMRDGKVMCAKCAAAQIVKGVGECLR